jgi:hypothetical protein
MFYGCAVDNFYRFAFLQSSTSGKHFKEVKLTTIELIDRECENIKALLIAKNKAYGNSFAEPINIFSNATPEEQINVRIDDKLNRIKKGQDTDLVPEDTELDLIGYLILKRVLRNEVTG